MENWGIQKYRNARIAELKNKETGNIEKSINWGNNKYSNVRIEELKNWKIEELKNWEIEGLRKSEEWKIGK